MNGTLFVYHPDKRLVAFQTGDFDRALVFIGGLTDGLLALHYLPELATELNSHHISLIQIFHHKSIYGTCSLATDTQELDILVQYLREKKNIREISFLGHSTGCQDIIKFLRDATQKDKIYKAILQGPVSDREYMATLPGTTSFVQHAKTMIEAGKEEDLMPRAAYAVPITAYRYHSLAGHLGDDDFFSSDITKEEMQELFKHILVPTLWVVSGADQYVPGHVNIPNLAHTLHAATPKSELLFLDDELHEISTRSKFFVSSVVTFLNT